MTVAEVERIVEECLVVGADIQGHRNGAGWIDAAARGVDCELSARDLDAANPPVSDAQDLLCVTANDNVDVIWTQTQCAESSFDVVGTIEGQIDAALPAVHVRVLLDGVPDGGVVDDGQQFGEVFGEHLEVEHLVAVVDLFQRQVAGEVVGEPLKLRPQPFCLCLQRQHGRR